MSTMEYHTGIDSTVTWFQHEPSVLEVPYNLYLRRSYTLNMEVCFYGRGPSFSL